jgi:cytochrome oxidase Cu insertion factor (SCO1/SenC/PrrC family)
MSAESHGRFALLALGSILIVTVAWWLLALYPAVAAAPEWVNRTRLACFGAPPGGLPNAGGWILLAGQPLGMLAVLMVVWGEALRAGLRLFVTRSWGRAILAAAGCGLAWGVLSAAAVVRRAAAQDVGFATPALGEGPLTDVPGPALLDQRGRPFDLATLKGGPVLVAFAFAHCEAVCPTLVRALLHARNESRRTEIPLVVVTLDPWRDVPARLLSIAHVWGLAEGDYLLSGEVDRVNAVLDSWGVARNRDPKTGDVSHSPFAVLVDRDGLKGTRLGPWWEDWRDILSKSKSRGCPDQTPISERNCLPPVGRP